MSEIIVNSISITPNPVITDGEYKISVEIYILYPSNEIYPINELYPTSENGSMKPTIIYPDDKIHPSNNLYLKLI